MNLQVYYGRITKMYPGRGYAFGDGSSFLRFETRIDSISDFDKIVKYFKNHYPYEFIQHRKHNDFHLSQKEVIVFTVDSLPDVGEYFVTDQYVDKIANSSTFGKLIGDILVMNDE